MLSVYALKPRFQGLLRPAVAWLAAAGVSANAVTLAAALLSCLLGALLAYAGEPRLFLLLPAWMLARMALNAIDGMLAREHGQASRLGAYLNELGDAVSDLALYLPFAWVAPFGWGGIGAVIALSLLSEMAGVLGAAFGGARRYDGPMGKSDRAVLFGALGLALGLAGSLPQWTAWIMPAAALLIAANIVNRVRGGLAGATGG